MFYRSLIILIISSLFVISCKENVTENEPPSLSDVKILHPSGGEKLIAEETDTIRWSHPETIETMGLYYTLDNGKNWITILYNEKIPSGEFIWRVPDAFSISAKIKIKAYFQDKESIIESDSVFQISRKIDIITPNTLSGLDIDTLLFIPNNRYNSLEFYYATNKVVDEYHTYYKDWELVNWIAINSNCIYPDSTLSWNVPNKSGPYKIKIIASFSDKTITYFSETFQIEEQTFQIKYPTGNEVFNYPGNIKIEWEPLPLNPENIKIYYSKFGINPNVIDSWILISDDIDPKSNEYIWGLPSIYSNQVNLKVVGIYSDSSMVEGISNDVFTIKDENVLTEEKQYLRKLGLGNKWVYFVTKDQVWYDDDEYYLVEEVIDTKIEDGIKYYNVFKQVIRDSITISNSWVADRENYSPSIIMQNGDSFSTDDYNYWKSCSEYEEEVFSILQKIKKYSWGDAYSNGNSKAAKDIGKYYYYNMVEGNLVKSNLLGAFIDGALYGDTTITR